MTESAVLGAKLLPPTARSEHLRRPRLEERIAAGLNARATVVVAGPGYGKSTLIAQFLRASEVDWVWYSLDGSDRDPWLFLQYLIHGIRQRVPEFGEKTSGLWESLQYRDEQIDRCVDVLIRDAEESLGGRLVLVLDRVEAISEDTPATHPLKRLLAYLPGTLHVVLVGRSIPRVGLQGLTAEGSARAIRSQDLLLTPEETKTLLVERFALALSPAAVATVHERTRGWVTALQLLRQTAHLDEGASIPVDLLERTEAEIFDYFSEEVLAAESKATREFLLSASVPSVLDPEIAADALGEATIRPALERVRDRRLFLSRLEGGKELYAFDPLFRDFLLEKLRSERGATGIQEINRAFGLAYQMRGDHVQALHTLMHANAPGKVAALLAAHGRSLLRGGSLDAVREAATSLTAQGLRTPCLDELLGEGCRLRGDYAAAVGHFHAALAAADEANADLRGYQAPETLQGLAYSLLRTGDAARAETTAERAIAAAGGADPGLVARILNTLSIVRYRSDRTEEAITGWQDALGLARQGRDEHLTRMIAHNLGLPHAARGDFQRATECFRILTTADNPRVGPEEGTAYLNLARIAILRGEYESAARLLDDAWEIRRKWNLRALAADVLEAQGTLLRETGDLAAAGAKYAGARALWIELGQLDLLDNLGEEEAILAGRRGETDRAERMVLEIVERARASGRSEAIASALLALGEIRAGSSAPAGAIQALEEARERFGTLGRAYQECAALVWLGLAATRARNDATADEAGASALRLSARFDYSALVLRVAALDEAYRDRLADLPAAPAGLRSRAAEAPPQAPLLGPLNAHAADLTVRILGAVEVYRDVEKKIPAGAWKLKRALRVFCYLAAARNHRATKERIADALWSDASRAVIEKNFHPTISFLRRALNDGYAVAKNFILFEGGAYSFNPDYRYDVDAVRFDRGITAAREERARGNADAALRAYDEALALYRGPFLDEEDDEWTEGPRTHYEALLDAALRESAELHVRQGHSDQALAPLERLVERHPADQAASIVLMRLHGSLGQRAAVEREYRRLQHATDGAAAGLRFETVRAYREILSRAGT